MADFYVMDKTRQQVRQWLQFKGDIKSLTVDCNSWKDDNGTVTTATWTVESGQAAISSEALASNVASCIVTTAQSGWSMLKLVISDGTHSEAIYIKVRSKDPQTVETEDYGMVSYG